MSQDYNFDQDYILGGRIAELSRRELLELARALCRTLMDVEGKYHGNIHPDNISRAPDGEIGLGPKADHGPGDWTSDELEYMAPELFWDRTGDITSDVYSIGMLLFAGVSGGSLPFFPADSKAPAPEERAAALRRRLSGDAIAIPAAAGEKLAAVMRRALAFKPEGRYSGPAEMLTALSACPDEAEALDEGEALPAAVPAAAAAAEAPEYKVDKNFEAKIPPKPKKSKKPTVIVFCICAALIVLALIIKSFSASPAVSPAPSSRTGLDAVTGTVSPSPSAGVSPSAAPDASASPEPTATAEPTPSPTTSPTPAPTPAPTPTPMPESTYELYVADISWTDAAEKCREMGGHLVTISDAAELRKVTDLADACGVKLVWIGFYRDLNGNLVWLNNEKIDYYVWGKGQPSVTDTDGTPENYGMLWYYGPSTGWIYNDSRNDPVADFPAAYSGKIAYICEYDG